MLIAHLFRDARAVSGDECQILRQAIMQIPGDSPALGQRGAPRQPCTYSPLGSCRSRQQQRERDHAEPLAGPDPSRGSRQRHEMREATSASNIIAIASSPAPLSASTR